MFPWNYGFVWDAGHIIFLGVFYTVVTVVVSTLAYAGVRAIADRRRGRTARVMWHENFEDLPREERACRHAFTGEMNARVCERGFACGACDVHQARYAHRMAAIAAGASDDSLGMVIPLDRFYHRGHVWARPEEDGTYTLGLDEVARRVAAQPERIERPSIGTRIEEEGTAWSMRVNGTTIRVRAPFACEVIEHGAAAWALRVRALPGVSFDHLLRGKEVISWLRHELERVEMGVSTTSAAMPALADGGVPVDNFPRSCPQADWASITGGLFLEN